MWFIIDLASNYLKTLRTRPDDAMDFFEMFDYNVKKVYEFVYFKWIFGLAPSAIQILAMNGYYEMKTLITFRIKYS